MGLPIVMPFLGSQFLLGMYAKVRKKEVKYNCPADFRPDVTVVVPTKNEAKRLPYALASLDSQTYELGKVVVVDDGSSDGTFEVAKLMRELTDLDMEIITRKKSLGKTPSLKMVAKKYSSDTIFVLDADTILEDDYIEKVRIPHFNEKVACSYGIVKPITREYKKQFQKERLEPLLSELNTANEDANMKLLSDSKEKEGFFESIKYYGHEWPVIKYREGVYSMEQHFSKDISTRLFDTTLFPVGCGVLYDRKKLTNVFDAYESVLGDNLTTSEDIFIGFDFCNNGFINAQVKDAHMMTAEPKIGRLPKQASLWGSSFIQSAYYFKELSTSFIEKNNRKPIGLTILPPILEKVSFLGVISYLAFYEPYWAAATIGAEFGFFSGISYFSTPKNERNGLVSSLVISEPVRLATIPLDLYIMGKFVYDLVSGNRNWKK